jgi:hypothetical protein
MGPRPVAEHMIDQQDTMLRGGTMDVTYYRRFISRALLCLLVVAMGRLAVSANADVFNGNVSRKRGVTDGRVAAVLRAGWYYTWYIEPASGTNAEFVPMIAHGKDANSWYFDRIKKLKAQGKAKVLLGFNEPERGEVSVDDAIRVWPEFEKTGLRLGSPAPAFDPAGRKWLDEFMTKANAKNLRVDFIALHWYGDVADPKAAAHFMGWLSEIHNHFRKPVWITEFAGLNWDWLHHPITAEMNQRFLSDLEPQLEQTNWVERYNWFNDKPANLFDDSKTRTLSRLGMIYRDGGR